MLYKTIALATIVGIMAMPANVATPKTDLKELDATDDVAKNADTTTETDVAATGCGTKYWKLSSVSPHTISVKLGECARDDFKYFTPPWDSLYFSPNNGQVNDPSSDPGYPYPSCEGNPMTKERCEHWAKNSFWFKYGNRMGAMPTYNMDISNKYNPPGCFVVTANNARDAPSIFYNSLSKSETDPAYGKCSDAKVCVCPLSW